MANPLPIVDIGPEFADCDDCDLYERCHLQKRLVKGRRPENWKPGGLMIIGDAPSVQDAAEQSHWTGQMGRVFRRVAEAAGVDLADCWQTYAVLGCPPKVTAKSARAKTPKLHEAFPSALLSCRSRLLEEIRFAQPRVILTVGDSALAALVGERVEVQKLVPFECPSVKCNPKDRKVIRHVFQCGVTECGWRIGLPKKIDPEDIEAVKAWGKRVIARHDGKCPECSARISRLAPKRIKCPTCGGKKRRIHTYTKLVSKWTLTGRDGVAGAIFEAEKYDPQLAEYGVKYIIPTYAPYFVARPQNKQGGSKDKVVGGQFAARPMAEHIRRANDLCYRDMRYRVKVISTEGMSDEEAARIFREYTREKTQYSADIETNSYDGAWKVSCITCIGFGHADREETIVVDTRHIGDKPYPGNPLYDAIVEFLEDETKGKTWWNFSYDGVVMHRLWDVEVRGEHHDGMLAHFACYPDEEHGLGFAAHELIDAPAWKDTSHKIPTGQTNEFSGYPSFEDLAKYSANDNRITALLDWELIRKPHARLDDEGVRQVYEIDRKKQRVAVKMEIAGLPVSRSRMKALRNEAQRMVDMHLAEMKKIAGLSEFKPAGRELVRVLYDPYGPLRLVPTMRGAPNDEFPQGEPLTSRDALLPHMKHPFVQHLFGYRYNLRIITHYTDSAAVQPGPDGRIHPGWMIHGARTGRWSAEGGMQTWPKIMRKAIKAAKGWKFVGIDYDQLELRGIGLISGDRELVRRALQADEKRKLEPEYDLHSYNASKAFGHVFTGLSLKDPAHYEARAGEARCKCDTCKRKALREVAKSVIYALNYGAGADKVHQTIYAKGYEGPPITVEMVARVMNAILTEFADVRRWREEALKRAMQEGAVYSPILKRRRIFPFYDIPAPECYNYPIQSLGADLIDPALIEIDKRLEDEVPDACLVGQFHDAILVECPEDDAEKVAKILEECTNCEIQLTPDGPRVPFTATAAIGDDWYSV